MKKAISIFMSLIFAISALLCLGGCQGGNRPDSDNGDAPVNLSLVMGVHDNFTKLSFNTEKIYEAIYETCYSYGSFTGIVVDGDPFVHCSYSITRPDKNVDNAKRRQIAKNNAKALIAECSTASAKSPEVDTLGAVALSAEALSSSEEGEIRKMVVYDSFLTTTSYLDNLSNNFFETDTELIIRKLKENKAIPDFSSIDVLVVGLGQVSGDQTDLPADYKAKLEELWMAIFEAGNAKSISFDKTPLKDEANQPDLPEVSTVPMPAEKIDGLDDGYYTFDNDTVKFEADSCSFANEDKAIYALRGLADELISNPSVNITIAGTTASADGDGIRLSLLRAEAVKDILVSEYDISESRISTVGLGKKKCVFHKDDLNPDGSLNEDVAPLNRAIHVFDSSSGLADSLKAI